MYGGCLWSIVVDINQLVLFCSIWYNKYETIGRVRQRKATYFAVNQLSVIAVKTVIFTVMFN